ncbi:hypothetical protein J40TS1_48440 [Paenibacillus montaniterrae]|uniref:N-acetyltransferase domain-containing protein n=1 Tax=Paenibacillus montaniterrae TaxID=429341 RepID=A0A919YR79_9BACL|nr:GNAT family N-acetyltransferase [Paenibacillus montaniterrae]GIP19202.1 hypothetical protein J40TS1_48440 [Paenibacillus montaniterrae]
MKQLAIRVCTEADLEMLAVLNKHLIEDEQHDNTMNAAQLKERMRSFIANDYIAYTFEDRAVVIGYALVDHSRQPLYLRQFFICREHRRMGYGTAAFESLLNHLNSESLDIEVLHHNERGYQFWKSLGFVERSVYMRRKSD